jgi:hypothetical protein
MKHSDLPRAIVIRGKLMARAKNTDDQATAQMALIGYEVEKQRIEERIREIRSLLAGKRFKAGSTLATAEPRAKRVLSPAARKRIVAAQRKRWAAYRERKAKAS